MSESQGTPTERAILSGINVILENQREHSLTLGKHSRILDDHTRKLSDLKQDVTSLKARMNDLSRSTEENFTEIRDLLSRKRDY